MVNDYRNMRALSRDRGILIILVRGIPNEVTDHLRGMPQILQEGGKNNNSASSRKVKNQSRVQNLTEYPKC